MNYFVFTILAASVVSMPVRADDVVCESFSAYTVRLLSLGLLDYRRSARVSPAANEVRPVPHTRNELPLGQRPETPVSIYNQTVDIVPDPEFPGRFMHVMTPLPTQNSGTVFLEPIDSFLPLLERYPNFFAPYGVTLRRENGQVRIQYPAIEGLNARIDRLGASRDGTLRFWRDLGAEDTDRIRLARGLVDGDAVISSSARTEFQGNYHFHDVIVHLFGTLAMPEPVVRSLRERLRMLFEIYDHPRLSQNAELRRTVQHMIERDVSEFDEGTSLLQRAVNRMLEGNRDRSSAELSLTLAIGFMGRGNRVLSNSLRQEEFYNSMSNRDRGILDGILSRQWYEPSENNLVLARQVLERFSVVN